MPEVQPLTARFAKAAQALLGVNAYANERPPQAGAVTEKTLRAIRKALGGAMQPLPQTQARWFLADLESSVRQADAGQMKMIGQLWRSMRRDGMIAGLTKTRTSGLVALPKRYRGREDVIKSLTAENGTRSVFDEMFPPAELAALAADGIGPGIGVAEMVPVVGRTYPVMVRLDPEFLSYRWNEGRWYFNGVAGQEPITPGDGRWILHSPAGQQSPWHNGAWQALGRAFITKEHAILHRANFSGKLANPARVVFAPNASTEEQRLGFLAKLAAWGINAVFALPVGWQTELLESNGRGWEVFGKEIETGDLEIMICLAGQVVTVTGGTGFANADIHKTIRADLIAEDATSLAHTINTQGLPPYIWSHFGQDALAELTRVAWDVKPPEDRETEARALGSVGSLITQLNDALAKHGIALDVRELIARFGVPILEGEKPITVTEPEPGSEDGNEDENEIPQAAE